MHSNINVVESSAFALNQTLVVAVILAHYARESDQIALSHHINGETDIMSGYHGISRNIGVIKWVKLNCE